MWIASHTPHSLSLILLTHTDLEWKVLYVSSAEDAEQDQVLEEVMVGPVPVGINKFVLQADAPDPSQIPEDDIIGVTVILITCSYREQEFVRVGYYVNNEYTCVRPRLGVACHPASYLLLLDGGNVFQSSDEQPTPKHLPIHPYQHPNTQTPPHSEAFDPENPPRPVDIAKLQRSILHEQPRVTRWVGTKCW